MLVACSAANSGAGPTPIPGSLTYGGPARSKLTKSPPGSYVYNSFYNSSGQKVQETYILQPDRTLKLTRQEVVSDFVY
ncbi:hypothetical protein SB748_05315 [Rhizobium sp. SIMBA_035]